MELLRSIESDAAGLAAERHTPEQMARLEAIMEELNRSQQDALHWNSAHWDFHVVILEAAANELMLFLFTALRRVIVAQKLFLHSQRQMRDPGQTYARQLAIFEAIRGRDPQAAAQAMRRHFDNAIARVELIMGRATGARD
jgi:DNA-binding FadR family transcriptional regulator